MKEKNRKFPNALVIVFAIMVVAMVLTWIVPAGKYEVFEGTSTLDPSSYHLVDRSPVSPWGLFQAVYGGMSGSAAIIAFTFMVGGLFNVIVESKSVDGFICYMIKKLGDHSNILLPVMFTIMCLLGASGVMANPVVAVIPMGLILAKRLKLDQVVALGVMYLAAYIGYATSPICALTVQIAQQIAEIPVLSGFGFRCLILLVFSVPTLFYVMRYVKKIQANPKASVMGEESMGAMKDQEMDVPFHWTNALALIGLAVGLGIYTYGSLSLGWSMQEMATIVLLIGLFTAIVTRMGVDGFIGAFIAGAKQMTFSAMLVGLAGGVSVILNSGNIIHTIIYSLGLILNGLPHALAGSAMFLFNLLFNFLVSSGSGQAKVVMPIMAPLADVVGLTRQAAVTAFQLGDGLSNMIFPTNGTLMACLAIAGIDFKKWTKWIMPLFIFWTILAIVVVALVVASGVA